MNGVLAALAKAKDETLWQAFGEYLAQDASDPVKRWRSGPGLSCKSTEAMRACLDSLARAPVAEAQERIAALYAKHAAKETADDVAYAALRALVRTSAKDARPHLLEATRHADWRLRLAAAQELPRTEPFDDEIAAAVRGLMQDEVAFVRQTVALGAGAQKRKTVAKGLIGLLTDPRIRTRHVASRALEQISGQKLGHDPKAWSAWLAEEDPGSPESMTFPTYHGFSVTSDRVVFLVDASSSMTWPWRKETHRIDVARTELQSVLGQLSPDTLFNVIVYAEKPVAKWAAKKMAEPKGDTFLYEALDAAYANNPEFDTIYLLTDGDPTAGRYWSQDGLLASVRAWTRYRRTAIHAIGLSLFLEDVGMPNLSEDRHAMKQLMQALAKATGGECRIIEKVPAKR